MEGEEVVLDEQEENEALVAIDRALIIARRQLVLARQRNHVDHVPGLVADLDDAVTRLEGARAYWLHALVKLGRVP